MESYDSVLERIKKKFKKITKISYKEEKNGTVEVLLTHEYSGEAEPHSYTFNPGVGTQEMEKLLVEFMDGQIAINK